MARDSLSYLNVADALIDKMWRDFLTSQNLDPSGNQPLPSGTDPVAFYRLWEKFIYSATPAGGATNLPGQDAGTGDMGVIPGGETVADDRGVYFYEHADYGGRQWGPYGPGRYRWVEDSGIPNDIVSSIKVPAGFRVQVFDDADFNGRSQMFNADAKYVGDNINDRMSSFVIVNTRK